MLTNETVPTQLWCLFKSDSRPFAVGVEAVAEVVEADKLVRLSLCPPEILGLCTVRRDIVPVLSLTPGPGAELHAGSDTDRRNIVLILHSEHGAWGIRIDREGTVVAEGVLDPAAGAQAGPTGPAIAGTLRRGDQSHAVIDPARTWRNVRENVEAWYRR